MPSRPKPAAALGLALLIAGCELPEVDAPISPEAQSADYPELVPLGPLVAGLDAGQIDAPGTQAALEARVSSLQSRAARLRGAGVTEAERARLRSGLD